MYICSAVYVLLVTLGFAECGQEKQERSECMTMPPYWRNPLINSSAASLYNSATEKCCLGSVYPKKKPAYEKCCGSGVFDSSKQLCCNDAIVPFVPGEACCGQKTINTDDAICCDGEEAKIAPEVSVYAKCCGKKAYDPRSQTCCYNGVGYQISEGENLQCCGDKAYKQGDQTCCTDSKNGTVTYKVMATDGNKTTCCGESVYDPNTEACCGDSVAPKMSGCCAGKAHNATTHFCCNDQPMEVEKGKNMGCCEGELFDSDTGICCTDYSLDGKELKTKTVFRNDSGQTACCGMVPFDNAKEICCYQTKKVVAKLSPDHYECCGDTSYSYSTGICCNNVAYTNVNSTTHECCGGHPMDRRESTCCGDKPLPILDSKSCCGGSETYNSSTQLCCSMYDANSTSQINSVIEKTNQQQSCCGSKAYDLEKELCCGEQVFPKSGNIQCCGSKTFDSNKEKCCMGTTVLPKVDGRDDCCLYGTTDARPKYPYYRYPYYRYPYEHLE